MAAGDTTSDPSTSRSVTDTAVAGDARDGGDRRVKREKGRSSGPFTRKAPSFFFFRSLLIDVLLPVMRRRLLLHQSPRWRERET